MQAIQSSSQPPSPLPLTTTNENMISLETWVAALTASACIGFTSLVPWLFNLTFFERRNKQLGQKDDRTLKYVLAFAVGAILGDIFFHLIPESINNHRVELSQSTNTAHQRVGLSVIAGIFVFIIVEVMLLAEHKVDDCNTKEKTTNGFIHQQNGGHNNVNDNTHDNNNNNNNSNSNNNNNNNPDDTTSQKQTRLLDENNNEVIDAAGYLSLIANGFDNFTHGLAIGASFLVSSKVGFLTAFVIFIHEIPHEICDYAILVNSGFTRWDAVKAQSSVSLFGILGTATSLCAKSIQALNSRTIWILPFSAGGFLYIALVNLLPEVLDRDTDLKHSILQVACVTAGVAFMGAVAIL